MFQHLLGVLWGFSGVTLGLLLFTIKAFTKISSPVALYSRSLYTNDEF